MKIKIYTGITVEPKKCLFDGLHPKFQIINFSQLVKQGEDFILHTNSDFIIRELNCFIMDGTLSTHNVKLFENDEPINGDSTGFEVQSLDDVIQDQNARSNDLYYALKYEENGTEI